MASSFFQLQARPTDAPNLDVSSYLRTALGGLGLASDGLSKLGTSLKDQQDSKFITGLMKNKSYSDMQNWLNSDEGQALAQGTTYKTASDAFQRLQHQIATDTAADTLGLVQAKDNLAGWLAKVEKARSTGNTALYNKTLSDFATQEGNNPYAGRLTPELFRDINAEKLRLAQANQANTAARQAASQVDAYAGLSRLRFLADNGLTEEFNALYDDLTKNKKLAINPATLTAFLRDTAMNGRAQHLNMLQNSAIEAGQRNSSADLFKQAGGNVTLISEWAQDSSNPDLQKQAQITLSWIQNLDPVIRDAVLKNLGYAENQVDIQKINASNVFNKSAFESYISKKGKDFINALNVPSTATTTTISNSGSNTPTEQANRILKTATQGYDSEEKMNAAQQAINSQSDFKDQAKTISALAASGNFSDDELAELVNNAIGNSTNRPSDPATREIYKLERERDAIQNRINLSNFGKQSTQEAYARNGITVDNSNNSISRANDNYKEQLQRNVNEINTRIEALKQQQKTQQEPINTISSGSTSAVIPASNISTSAFEPSNNTSSISANPNKGFIEEANNIINNAPISTQSIYFRNKYKNLVKESEHRKLTKAEEDFVARMKNIIDPPNLTDNTVVRQLIASKNAEFNAQALRAVQGTGFSPEAFREAYTGLQSKKSTNELATDILAPFKESLQKNKKYNSTLGDFSRVINQLSREYPNIHKNFIAKSITLEMDGWSPNNFNKGLGPWARADLGINLSEVRSQLNQIKDLNLNVIGKTLIDIEIGRDTLNKYGEAVIKDNDKRISESLYMDKNLPVPALINPKVDKKGNRINLPSAKIVDNYLARNYRSLFMDVAF